MDKEGVSAWWVVFLDNKKRCFEGTKADVAARAAALGTVKSILVLPYPAEPREDPKSNTPSLCYKPDQCVGRTACPQRYACSE